MYAKLRKKISNASMRMWYFQMHGGVASAPFDTGELWSLANPQQQADMKALCAANQKILNDSAHSASLSALVEDIGKKTREWSAAATSLLERADTIETSLRGKKTEIQKAIGSFSAQQQVSANLPIIMAIIGGFSIGIIVIVKLFENSIQREWVISGQVIQFMTVTVLISVVMALGLSGILHENTLGTLLGGVGGYVLAPGIGRAAVRAVTSGQEALAASVVQRQAEPTGR